VPRSIRDPHPSEALLIVEVAQTSLEKDRGVKSRLYASAGVVEYWIVDLQAMTIEVRTKPGQGAYARCMTVRAGDTIRLVALPDVKIRVRDVLE
jgi:Uma2 family endonuclease